MINFTPISSAGSKINFTPTSGINPQNTQVKQQSGFGGFTSTSPFNPNSPNSQFVNPNPQVSPIKNALQGVNNFVNALPQAAEQTVLGTPARFSASVAEVPKILHTGKATDKTYNLPGLDPFQSIQTQESQRMQQGMSPVKAATLAGVNAVGSGIATAGMLEGTKQGIQGGIEAISNKINSPTNISNQVLQNVSKGVTPTYDPEVAKIQEIISPKINASETKDIYNQARITKGGESLFFGKQPDIVSPSDAVQNSARIINDNIPKASSMNDAELLNALKSKIDNRLWPKNKSH